MLPQKWPAATLEQLILYYITDRSQFSGSESARQERLLECVTSAAHAGVDYIQLREKDLPDDALEALARAVMERVRQANTNTGTHTRLLINSRVAVAVSTGADGVHLPAHGVSIASVKNPFRERGMDSPIIGVSCHTREEVIFARTNGADFAVFGPVFEKPGLEKKDGSAGAGVARLREACAAVAEWPVLALGGVTTDNAGECMRTGAAGVAGIRLFQSDDMAQTVAALRRP